MSFNVLEDITTCAKLALRLYEYGFSKAKNAARQYNEFGQDVYKLHENLLQLANVFKQVERQAKPGAIPTSSDFYKTSSLNSILDDPFKTIEECHQLLHQRRSFSGNNGFISNVYWNVAIEADVTMLHDRVKFHNVRILALLKPLEIKLLLDIRSEVQNYGEAILSQLVKLEAKFFGTAAPPSTVEVESCEQIQMPDFLRRRFEDASKNARPELPAGDTFPMNEGINAFLTHHKDDAPQTFSGFVLLPPTQSPKQYLRMMKATWIIQCVLASPDYTAACSSGNRLLKWFVEGLAQKCLDVFKLFANKPPDNIFQVRNQPSEATLNPLGSEAFAIWPKIILPPDRFDAASSENEAMKIILRAPLQHQSHSRHKELILLKHDTTVLEMITKEFSMRLESTNSTEKNIDLKVVALNAIYADPDIPFTPTVRPGQISSSASRDLCLYTFGTNGPNELISFQAFDDLYQFQAAITGYRVVCDIPNIETIIRQDDQLKWATRAQLWSFTTGTTPGPSSRNGSLLSPNDPTSPISPISPPSSRRTSSVSNRTSGGSSSNQASHHSSTRTFMSTTTQATAISSLVVSENDRRTDLEAETFVNPKEPLLVLFLRPRRQRTHLPQNQFVSLMKIPISQKSAFLQTSNCSCKPAKKHECVHSIVTGVKKMISHKQLTVQWYKEQGTINLAELGVHHQARGLQEVEKVTYAKFTFSRVQDREDFDHKFMELQTRYNRKLSAYEDDKRSIRIPKDERSSG